MNGDARAAVVVDEFFLDNCLSASTEQARRNTGVVRKFLAHSREPAVSEFAASDIRDYLIDQKTIGASEKTLRNHLASLGKFFEFLVANQYAAANPCRGLRLRRPEKRPPNFLTPEEIAQALAISLQHDVHCEVALAVYAGLRMEELRRLEWRDLDIPGKTLLVRRSKSRRPRTVPLCRAAIQAVLAQRMAVPDTIRYLFPGWMTSAKRTMRDAPRGRDWWLKVALKPIQAAVPKFRLPAKGSTGRGWHLLRHTFATLAVRADPPIDLFRLSRWLGHQSVETTKIYAHLASGYDEAIERIG